jgi:hypothetical protein
MVCGFNFVNESDKRLVHVRFEGNPMVTVFAGSAKLDHEAVE